MDFCPRCQQTVAVNVFRFLKLDGELIKYSCDICHTWLREEWRPKRVNGSYTEKGAGT